MTTEGAQTAEKVALTDAEFARRGGWWKWDQIADIVAARVAEAVDRERAAWATKVGALAEMLQRQSESECYSDGDVTRTNAQARAARDLRGLLAADDTEGKP